MVSSRDLVKGSGNLNETLEEHPQIAFFAQPRLLPGLVRLEEAPIIEERSPPLDGLRRPRPHPPSKKKSRGLAPALVPLSTVDCRLL
jgi:hypothetical protein